VRSADCHFPEFGFSGVVTVQAVDVAVAVLAEGTPVAWIAASVRGRTAAELEHFVGVAEAGPCIVDSLALRETVDLIFHDGARRAFPGQRGDCRWMDSAYTRSHLDLVVVGLAAKGQGLNLV